MAQAVNVMDIVDSRSQEITAAMEALKTNMSVSYKLSIPFYMRRRAASHNPKRLPARVRPPDATRSKTKFKWKKRKGKKEESAETAVEEDSGKVEKEKLEECEGKVEKVEGSKVEKEKRLETHLWHAKRCHMANLWCYRLALRSTQKGDRAAHRAANIAATVQDTSYYQWVSLSGESLHEKLNDYLVPNHFTPHRVTCAHLYHAGVCLGPVRVMWMCDRTVFLRLHPAVLHHTPLHTIFSDLPYTSHIDSFSQFTVRGVRSLELLVRSLSLSDTTNEVVREVWDNLTESPFHYDVMGGTVLGCQLVVPPAQHRNFVSAIDSEILQPVHRLSPGSSLSGDLLFQSTLANTDSTDKSDITDNTLTEGEPGETVPCCIYKDPSTGSLTVVIPRGTGTKLWISLIYNGGRVIGLQDAHSLNTGRSTVTFPADYPDTLAGRKYAEMVGQEKEGKEMRRPPQKRVKYGDLGITSPFVPDWRAVCGSEDVSVIREPGLLDRVSTLPTEMEHHLVTVSITCTGRGNVRPGAHIYLDSTQSRDHSKSRDLSKSRDPVYGSDDVYPVVGYVTSGKYCLTSGRGAGIGLILSSVFKQLEGGAGLLVRNTTSRQYRRVGTSLVR